MNREMQKYATICEDKNTHEKKSIVLHTIKDMDNVFIGSAEQDTALRLLLTKTEGRDLEWEERFAKNRFWYHEYKAKPDDDAMTKRLYRLRDRMLKFGGTEVLLDPGDDDLNSIYYHGQLWFGNDVTMIDGEASRCHGNASDFWYANCRKMPDLTICTGYALSEDGLWRQHSWLINKVDDHIQIYETTEKRLAYYGCAFDNDEAAIFAAQNCY